MGDFATPQALLHRWEEMQHDPSLHALPYKIELSPASVRMGNNRRRSRRLSGNSLPTDPCRRPLRVA
jgi:hypothetical protein